MPSNHLTLRRPLLLLPSIFPSIRVFSSESVLCIRWPKYWIFSFSISPSNEYSGLISFRMDWFDPLAVQRTLKSLLQHQNLKASILWRSAFFMVQLSHPYMSTGKTIALTRWTFVGKVMSLLFNMLCKLVIAFLPMLQPCILGNKLTQKHNADSGVQFITPWAQGRVSSQPRTPTSFCGNLIYPNCTWTLHCLKEYANYLCNRKKS